MLADTEEKAVYPAQYLIAAGTSRYDQLDDGGQPPEVWHGVERRAAQRTASLDF